MPVLERDSVILASGLTEIQRDDQITWKFNGTLIGQLKNLTTEISANVLDGRFKDRLQLNQQNGSLIITNIRPNTAGPYEVDIKSGRNYTTHKTFRVTIIGESRLILKCLNDLRVINKSFKNLDVNARAKFSEMFYTIFQCFQKRIPHSFLFLNVS